MLQKFIAFMYNQVCINHSSIMSGIPLKTIQTLAGKVIVKSSVNPLLWLCSVIGISCLIIISTVHVLFIQIFMMVIVFLLVICTLVAYFYFMFNNPDYLRSEEYQLQKQAMQLGDQNSIMSSSDLDEIESIKNPKLLEIKSKE